VSTNSNARSTAADLREPEDTASIAPQGLVEIYRAFSGCGGSRARAQEVIEQQHWFASIAEFDPKTGDALPLAFTEVLHRTGRRGETRDIRDRLWRIVDHCRSSIERIFASLNENPRREQAYLPIRDVKELNAASFIALSRRPGRNVREKLAGRPYMQAVRRFQSVDLPENRLVREFVTRLAELLELRKKHLGHEDNLLGDIYRWLRTDEAKDISRWDNVPPNNTLLSHRDYRRVWDGWRWLQLLDNAVDRDLRQLEGRATTIKQWEIMGAAYAEGKTLFGEMPVLFDYDSFAIKPWSEPVARSGSPARRDLNRLSFDAPACVDLTYLRPRFAVGCQAAQHLPEAFLWQRWSGNGQTVDLEVFHADIALLSRDATTISITDLFFAKDADDSLVDWAAHAFTRKLSKTFANPILIWLVPDFLNDFQLQSARRNINARFARAEPLPRSIAAAIEQFDYSRITGPDFHVLIVDSTGGTTYATKLTAQHDEELQQRVPETRGFYWERSPHVTLAHNAGSYDPLVEITRILSDERCIDSTPLLGVGPINQITLRNHNQIGSFDVLLTVTGSPVTGGLRLHELQHRAGDIPLWRDHVPALSIKVISAGRYQPFFLVDRGTTIRPLRGIPVEIPLKNQFTLPAGRLHYQFPLFQGQDPDDLGYVARLESPAFPLTSDTICRLTMTYTYGADDPYKLVFEPLDGSFVPVQVKWRPKTEEVITDAPAPDYPPPLSWADLQHHYYAPKDRWNDYLDWLVTRTTGILEELENRTVAKSRQTSGIIERPWMTDRNGQRYTFVSGLFLHERALRDGLEAANVRLGDLLYFDVLESPDGRQQADNASTHPATTRQRKPVDAGKIRTGLFVPYIKIWGDARSLADPACPLVFKASMTALVGRLERATRADSSSAAVQRDLRFLLCCMHRDMPTPVRRSLLVGTADSMLDEFAYGFALSDLAADWQYDIFVALWNRADAQMLSIFAIAIWRTEVFVRLFDQPALAWLGHVLLTEMRKLNEVERPSKGDIHRLTQYCELILGLLRSRESDLTEVRMTLQPHQELTKNLAEQVEATLAAVARAGFPVRSRVEISNIPDKPEGETTPDLLYALRLYLTGDVGANAIRVTGVTDGVDD
jgi:hypothetical protein